MARSASVPSASSARLRFTRVRPHLTRAVAKREPIMSHLRRIACTVTSPRRPRPESYKPPAEFGQRAIELTKAIGKTPEDLVHAVGYESKKTLDRLAKGEGSLEFALAIRDQLQDWGADVSTLPPLGVERAGAPLEPWEREWLQLGRSLRDLASDERFEVEHQRIREVIRAHEIVAEGTGTPPRRRA